MKKNRRRRRTREEDRGVSKELTASINCFTSYSDSFVPCLQSPCRSSSIVILPLLSVSMALNISFKPCISSSDKHPAITFKTQTQKISLTEILRLMSVFELTRRATFLNLFIALNCFSRLSTALSRGISGASPSLIHG